jgi:CubicO group peptidase (beta-lactamase class C family)
VDLRGRSADAGRLPRARNPTTGLLVARGDTIVVERYQCGRTDRHRFTSWSMAKTVTAMRVSIAIAEGHIRSVDDLAAVERVTPR